MRIKGSFDCVGMSYHEEAINALRIPNDDYDLAKKEIGEAYEDEHVYKWCIDGVLKLEPEPDNEADPNAVRVSCDGETIAYVKREETARVKELLSEGCSYNIVVSGGEYKAIEDDQIVTGEDPIEVTAVFFEKDAPEKKKGSRALMTVLAALLLVGGLLLLIVSPVAGIAAIVFAVVVFLMGRKQ